jgi:hypothetical protein
MTLYVVVDGKDEDLSQTLCRHCMKEVLAKHPLNVGEFLRTTVPTWVENGLCQHCGDPWQPLTLE